MVTIEKLKIYIRYRGDVDMWTRIGSSKERSVMNTNDWYMIDDLIQDLGLVKKQVASNEFVIALRKRLDENCDSEETIKTLESI